MFVTEAVITDLWRLDLLDITDSNEKYSKIEIDRGTK